MTRLQVTLLQIYGGIVAAWVVRHLFIHWMESRLKVLTRTSPAFAAEAPPRVTAIIPAKDEEQTLADCLASVCAQTYPDLRILVVNDRSTDGTAAVAEEFAAADPRIRLLNIEELPTGWTGKNHALHVAAGQTDSPWLWFLDADTRHAPESLSVMMEFARRESADLVSLVTELRCESFWERVLQPLEGIVLMRSFSPVSVNDDRARIAFANGQYILIRQDAYRAAGGHAAVRDRFVEDIYLAQRVKDQGHRTRVAMSTEISSTRMYTSLPQMINGWSRILYDAVDRRISPLALKILEPIVFSQSGDVALLVAIGMLLFGGWSVFAGWLLGLSVVHQVLKTSLLYRMYLWSAPRTARSALLYPLAGIVSAWITWRAIQMCLTGQVRWRGTVYGSGPTGPDTPGSLTSTEQPDRSTLPAARRTGRRQSRLTAAVPAADPGPTS